MIRSYTPVDADACAWVLKRAFAAAPWNEEWSLELARTRIQELMCSPMSIGYVYEEEGCILGMMLGRKTTYLHGVEYFIDEFCIAPEAQRKGIGTRMLAHAREELMPRGFEDIVLNTERSSPAERFYSKNGFVAKDSLIFMYWDF
ncbi:MAG: GNAT family N-acetyltransferase [Ruminococcus sp.]|nr:GNAT family N-acetyltransferase [Ruminococcus sp.]